MCDIEQSVKDEFTEIQNLHITSDFEENCEPASPELINMPVEIILKICSFLDADFLKFTLSKVCQRFDDILADEHLWKFWVHSKIKGYFPVLPHLKIWDESPIAWEDICVEMDVEKKKWCNIKERTKHVVIKDVHYASVDAVLLANKGEICFSGGRDRAMAFWHINDLKPNDANTVDDTYMIRDAKPRHIKHDAHAGWVWDMAVDNIDNASVIYSASWDNSVKAWDLGSGLNCIETFRCGMSALSVVTADNLVMAGLYSKKIVSFDLRSGSNPISSYMPHRGPVLTLSSHKNMIASVSEDRTLAVWDRVAGKLLKNDIKIPAQRAYPVCLSWSSSALYIGDAKGSLHLFNPEDYNFVKTYEIWPGTSITTPPNKIAACHQSNGNIILCSDRGEIKYLYNSNPPQEYSTAQTSTISVTELRYLNGVLVIGTCDSALEFWIPNERFSLE